MPVVVYVIFKTEGHALKVINPLTFLLASILINGYLGVLPLYFGWDEYYVNINATDKFIYLRILIFSAYSMIGITLGYFLIQRVLPKPKESFIKNNGHINTKTLLFFAGMLAVVVFTFMLYLSKLPQIALFIALTEGYSEDVRIARSLMGNDFAGNYHWYSLIIHQISNLLTFTLYAGWIKSKRKSILTLFVISFMVSSLAALVATEKAPFIWLLIGLFITSLIVKKNGVFKLKKLFIYSPIAIAVMVWMFMTFMGSDSVGDASKALFSRVFSGSIGPSYFYLELFPEHEGFLLGRSFPNPGGLIPFDQYRLTVEVMRWKFPGIFMRGAVGSAPTIFWAEMYANFSLLGVIIAPIFVGVYLYVIYLLISRLKDSMLKVGVYVWVIMHYGNLSLTSLSNYIIDIKIIAVIAVLLLYQALTDSFKIKYYKSSYGW